MGEQQDKQNLQEEEVTQPWQIIKDEDELCCESMDPPSPSSSALSSSLSSSLSSEVLDDDDDDDDTSSSSSSCPQSSSGPLYELSQLMDHLPIKRGLSKFYNGKSQSFASLADAGSSGEDLAKKGSCYNRRMKWSKSYGGNLNQQKFGPKAVITKTRSPRRSFSPSLGTIKGY